MSSHLVRRLSGSLVHNTKKVIICLICGGTCKRGKVVFLRGISRLGEVEAFCRIRRADLIL